MPLLTSSLPGQAQDTPPCHGRIQMSKHFDIFLFACAAKNVIISKEPHVSNGGSVFGNVRSQRPNYLACFNGLLPIMGVGGERQAGTSRTSRDKQKQPSSACVAFLQGRFYLFLCLFVLFCSLCSFCLPSAEGLMPRVCICSSIAVGFAKLAPLALRINKTKAKLASKEKIRQKHTH